MKFINKYEEEIEIELGDMVGFKTDIEQYGEVISLSRTYVVVENKGGFCGDYIGGDTIAHVPTDDIWKD